MKEVWLNVLEFLGMAWWLEVVTDSPSCTYYFGPYASDTEAEMDKAGFIEDLEQEGAKGIVVTIKRCKPVQLTIFEDASDRAGKERGIAPVFSGQL